MHTPATDSLPTTLSRLTAALQDSGTLRDGAVETLAVTERLRTVVSNLWFLSVDYTDGSRPLLPNRLLLKWPVEGSPAPDGGASELVFYRELAPALTSPPIVRCLATAPSSSAVQWLLLEDLRSTHTNPSWPQRLRGDALEAAVSTLARIHAQWWEAPTLGTSVGTLHTRTTLTDMVRGIAAHLPLFFDDLGSTLSVDDRVVLETVFGSSLNPWFRLVDGRALTVVHGDAHPWNFLFPRSGHGIPYLIDWQLWHLDVGARDLAFMIALHWDRAARPRAERSLLHVYHQQLASAGISDYSLDDLWLDYRRCVVRNLTIPIILWARGLPPDNWRHRLDCALAAYRDLDGGSLL